MLVCLLLVAMGSVLPQLAIGNPAPRWTAISATIFKHTTTPFLTSGATIQDRSGFLWFGTQSGLLRWDGYTLRRYAADNRQPRSIPDTFIRALHIDRSGTLWIGASAGGMARYDAESDDFTVFAPGPKGVSGGNVTAFADDGEGGIWIGTSGGIDHMSASGSLTQAADQVLAGTARGSQERDVEALLHDSNGILWIGTRKGLLQLAPKASTALPFNVEAEVEQKSFIMALFEDSAGRIWVGTHSKGALMIERGASHARAVRETGAAPAFQRQRVFSIAEVSPQEIWFGTEGAGILALDPTSGNTRRIRHHQGDPDSLRDNDIYFLLREKGGMMVVGSTDACSLYDPRPQSFITVRDDGLPNENELTVPSLMVRPDGTVWAGVGGGGIDIIDPQLGGIAQLSPGKEGRLPGGRVLSMVNGPDGTVFVGTQQGLYRVDAATRQVQQVQVPQRGPTASAWALAYRDGVLWMGGLDGLWALDLSAKHNPATVLRHERTSLGESRVTSILLVDGGGMWIGTRAGLAYLASPQAPLEVVPSNLGDSDRLLAGFTSGLTLDQRGRLWVATFGRGVQVLERTDPDGRRRFRRLEMAHGLPDNSVNTVLTDGKGMIWASTDNGLARIDPSTFAIKALGPSEGVHITKYWTNSGAVSTYGELLFGGNGGLTVVHPERLAAIDYQAPVVVTDLALNDKPVIANRYNGPHANATGPLPIEITASAKERGFSLEFAALDYSASARAQYAYRLLGFDGDWVRTAPGSRRLAYTNLPPGTYTLELRASTRDGSWMQPLSVPVRALPSWYQTLWARLLAVLLSLAGVAWLVRLRTAFYRRRQIELEAMVTQRTVELRASQAQLEQLAYADPLTGLPNRRMFNDELRRLKAQAVRDQTPFTLLLIDLDHFKQVNDTLGHDAGDALLIEVARRMRLALRETDQLARLGGDEFAVLLSNTQGRDDVDMVARRIVDSVAAPVPFGVHRMQVGASIGVAPFCPAHGGEQNDLALYKQADLALYQAKSAGRATWVWAP